MTFGGRYAPTSILLERASEKRTLSAGAPNSHNTTHGEGEWRAGIAGSLGQWREGIYRGMKAKEPQQNKSSPLMYQSNTSSPFTLHSAYFSTTRDARVPWPVAHDCYYRCKYSSFFFFVPCFYYASLHKQICSVIALPRPYVDETSLSLNPSTNVVRFCPPSCLAGRTPESPNTGLPALQWSGIA